MRLQWMLSTCVKFFLALTLLFPFAVNAAILTVTATTPFPANVSAGSTVTAIYTVTNTSAQTTLTAIDQSSFEPGSGLSITANTCGTPMTPGQSCTIQVTLNAPSSAQTVLGYLMEWAKPSAFGLRVPITVNVILAYNVTASVSGGNGSISPSGVTTIAAGASQQFTATPDAGFGVNAWLLDGALAQTGGTTYNLTNVTANHTLSVSFTPAWVVTPSAGANGAISPNVPTTVNDGDDITFTATPDTNYSVDAWFLDGSSTPAQVSGTSYTLTNVSMAHDVNVTFKTAQGVGIAAGVDITNSLAMVAISTDAGTTWSNKNTPAVFPFGHFAAASCTGSGATVATDAVCVAAGDTSLTPSCPACAPLLGVSKDGGDTWALETATSTPASGRYHASGCTGIGVDAICVAAGRDITNSLPFLSMSTDGGNNWAVTAVTGAGAIDAEYNAASCTGTTATAVCMAAGRILSGAPIIASSVNGGATWSIKTISGTVPVDGNFASASCTGTTAGAGTVCVAAGQNTGAGFLDPLLAVSVDGGASYTIKFISGIPAKGTFTSTSCTGSGATARCIAVGQNLSNSSPLISTSVNGAANWTTVTSISGAPATGIFNTASCTGTGNTAICIAAGENLTDGGPMVAVSTDGAASWAIVNTVIGGFPTDGSFLGSGCTGSTSTGFCTVAGQDTSSGNPAIAYSKDGGVTWIRATITDAPANGIFYGGSATGGVFAPELNLERTI